jgi:tRNA(Ile)-lysidine synthase
MMKTSELQRAKWMLQETLPAGSRSLCAVSGGLDSMCLLHFMATWGRAQGFFVAAAHFNHQLRGEDADRDETFVRDWCAARGIPFTAGRGDVRGLAEREGRSVEEAARRLRYEFLHQAAETLSCGEILTAHNADDNAETMLLNLVRGTGLKGLCGIPRERDEILRPFLQITRKELEEYAAAYAIPHVEDATNTDPDAAARNLLRLQVMPLLREINPGAVKHMNATAEQLNVLDCALEEDARRRAACANCREGSVTLPRRALDEAPESVRPRMLLRLLDLLGVGRKDVGAVHLEAVLNLARHAGGGGRLSLPHGVTARYSRGALVLERRPQMPAETELLPGQPCRWGEYILTLLEQPAGDGLALRPRREDESRTIAVGPCLPGGRLTLPGTNGGARSVKRLCLDRHVGLAERDGLPAIYAGGRLAAVWKLGVDKTFLPEGGACRFIQIIKETEENKT